MPNCSQIAEPEVLEVPDTLEGLESERGWNVIVWDDPVNTMEFVVYVFRTMFGFSKQKATVLMYQVHNDGKAIVATEPRELAEKYCATLHEFGLLATIEEL